jgi:aldehyde:ferredoxin oxidoreductase
MLNFLFKGLSQKPLRFEAKFEKMKREYYELRGWDVPSGLPTMTKLQELELTDVASGLAKRGLLK